MSSVIWEPLEVVARELVKFGKLRPVVEVKDGVAVRITVVMGEGLERSWTLEDAQKARARVLD